MKISSYIPGLFCLLAVLATRPAQAGLVLEYQGLDWLISKSDDIVVAKGIAPPEQPKTIDKTGRLIISGLPDIQNGVECRIQILHVLKGTCTDGETTTIFAPIAMRMYGDAPLEYPEKSLGNQFGPGPGEYAILFLQRTRNKPSLETIPCIGSVIQADAKKLAEIHPTETVKTAILRLIDQSPVKVYESYEWEVFSLKSKPEQKRTVQREAHNGSN